MKKPMTKEQTKRLKSFVYDLLTKTPYTPENPIDQREMYERCRDEGFDVSWDESQNQHSDHCRWLTKIVDELSCDSDFDKVVWHFGYRYFACDYEEALLLLELREQRIALASVRIRKLKKKIRRHNQGSITANPRKKFHTTFVRRTSHKDVYFDGRVKCDDEAELWSKHAPEVEESKRLAVYRDEIKKDGKVGTRFRLKWMSD